MSNVKVQKAYSVDEKRRLALSHSLISLNAEVELIGMRGDLVHPWTTEQHARKRQSLSRMLQTAVEGIEYPTTDLKALLAYSNEVTDLFKSLHPHGKVGMDELNLLSNYNLELSAAIPQEVRAEFSQEKGGR